MAPRTTQTGSKAVRAIFEAASDLLDDDADLRPMWRDPNLPRDGVPPGKWDGAPFAKMPDDSRVKVIGADAEHNVWLLTARGYLMQLERIDFQALSIAWAPYVDDLLYYWPAWGNTSVKDEETGEIKQTRVVKRVEIHQVTACIMGEAGRKPLFDPHTQHRGRGGWLDGQGRFIWHSGDYLWTSETGGKLTKVRPQGHDGHLYTRAKPTVQPWRSPVDVQESPAQGILQEMRSWNWERPLLDPVLALGWIATAIYGGALKARPIVFITGGHGTGKSTFQELMQKLLAGIAYSAVDTTAAGIYQKVKHDSLPFLVDELESKAGSSKSASVIELARVAYTGGDISRGGSEHEGTTFKMHTSFLFSAINPPPMEPQDKSRMAMLNLQRFTDVGKTRKAITMHEHDVQMIVRQLIDGWQEFNTVKLPYYWRVLQEQGFDARAIDTFGTLLAAAETLVGQDALDAIGLQVTSPEALGALVMDAVRSEQAERMDNWHAIISHLFDSAIDGWRDGAKPMIGDVCDKYINNYLSHDATIERLYMAGLSVLPQDKVPQATGPLLAIPASGPHLLRLFEGTAWHRGVHYGSLKQAPESIVFRRLGNKQKVKINGKTANCLLLDIRAFQAFAERAGMQSGD